MKTIKKKILTYIKKIVDKYYYNEYTYDKDTLIREMFPWIINIWEYKKIDSFLRKNSPSDISDLIEAIWAFYRWEVDRCTKEWKFQEIERYQWLIDFSQSIRDYQEYILLNKNEK